MIESKACILIEPMIHGLPRQPGVAVRESLNGSTVKEEPSLARPSLAR
jgi:hypothetical protein